MVARIADAAGTLTSPSNMPVAQETAFNNHLDQARQIPPPTGPYGALPPDQQQQVVAPQQQRVPWELDADPDGETKHEVKDGETWDDIAAEYGLTRDDVLLTNPSSADGEPEAGDTVTVLHDAENPEIAEARLDIAQEMAATDDPEELEALIAQDIQLATLSSATPEDLLEAVQADLIARRPGDDAFAELVERQGAFAKELWAGQGRTHDVFDPLARAARAGDWETFQDIVLTQYATIAIANPTEDAIKNHSAMLLTYGPDDERFRQAVGDAEHEFLVAGPQRAAGEVQAAFEERGPLGAAAKLRELTNPETADPLTAALIFEQSEPTLAAINDEPAVGVYLAIFYDLSAAADSASRSGRPETFAAIERLAGHMLSDAHYEPLSYQGVIKHSVGEGDGTVLPLAMVKHLRDTGREQEADFFAQPIREGLEDLKSDRRGTVGELGETALPLVEPYMNWGPFFGAEEMTLEEMLAEQRPHHPEEVAAVDDILEQLNGDGYQLIRALAGIDQYRSELSGLEAFDGLVAENPFPDSEAEPELAYAAAVSPAAMVEALRAFNMEGLERGELIDPYDYITTERSQTVADASWPIRMIRSNLQADVVAWRTFNNQIDAIIRSALSGQTVQPQPGARPVGAGLSLFGVATYLWGTGNHATELGAKVDAHGVWDALWQADGWRNAGFLLMYGAGSVIEGRQALALARNPSNQVWGKAFANHIKLFGWYNVVGTANYALQGDWPRAGALGTAATGTLLAAYGPALGWGAWTGPVGTALVILGSAALFALDLKERADLAAMTEPFNEAYLIRNGIRPEIANELANNDSDGLGPAPRLLALANYLNIEPQELLDWLNQQDAEFVGNFVQNALHPIKPDGQGNYPESAETEYDINAGTYRGDVYVYPAPHPDAVAPTDPDVWYRASIAQARTLEGIRLWAEAEGHPLPSG